MARWVALAIFVAVIVVLALAWNVEGALLVGGYVLILSGVGWVTGGFGGAVRRWAGRLYDDDSRMGDAERHAQRASLFHRPPRS
jgi:hypothetical protein